MSLQTTRRLGRKEFIVFAREEQPFSFWVDAHKPTNLDLRAGRYGSMHPGEARDNLSDLRLLKRRNARGPIAPHQRVHFRSRGSIPLLRNP